MKTVYKYPIEFPADEVVLDLPFDAVFVSIGVQNGGLFLWAMVDPEAAEAKYRLLVRGTGHPIDEAADPLGSFMLHGGALVFHVFQAFTHYMLAHRGRGNG